MHAFLLVNPTSSHLAGIHIDEITHNAKVLEFEVQKIADVKKLREFIRLKQAEKIFIRIENFDLASHETQNAMLKLLEEPQENIAYILFAKSEDLILPTIISRCEVIRISGIEEFKEQSGAEEYKNFLEMSKVKQMITIKEYRKREEAVEFLNGIITTGRKLMRKGKMKEKSLERMLVALKNIQGNGNSQIQLTAMVLEM